jgi:uncharacterized membrane protein YjjP (DUF1212 family)
VREIGPPGINVERIADLQRLGKSVGVQFEPGDIAAKLGEIESKTPWYSNFQIAVAVGIASGAFAFLNGAAAAEMIATAIGGGVGQLLRSWLSRLQFNQYGAVAFSAVVASGVYVLLAALEGHAGIPLAHYPAGFIASVLFLVPGFPLIAALFDLLQYQTWLR